MNRLFFDFIFFFLSLFFGLLPGSLWAWVDGDFNTVPISAWSPVTVNSSNNFCLGNISVVASGGTAVNTVAGELSTTPPGFPNAVQLISGDSDNGYGDYTQITQTDVVPGGASSTLSFWFAGVFENYHYSQGVNANPVSQAEETEDAYLAVTVTVGGANVATLHYNWSNNLSQIIPIPTSSVPGEGNYVPCENPSENGSLQWGYIPWTQYQINLANYQTDNVTFQASAHDCDFGGHYSVGYITGVTWIANAQSQVTLTKTNSPTGTVGTGTTITYTLSYSNPATFAVAGVEINDTIPTGTSLVPGSVSSSPSLPVSTQVGNDLIWSINSLAAGSSGTISYQVVVNNCSGNITNVAAESDLDAGNVTSNSVVNSILTCTPSNTPTVTNTPTITPTPTNTGTPTNTYTPTCTGTFTMTPTPTCVTYVWPDPYNPNKAFGGSLKISCMNSQSKVDIFTISGELVQTLDQTNQCQFPSEQPGTWGYSYCWNGRNKQNFPVATGIYFYVVQEGSTVIQRGKFLMVNGS